MGYTVHPVPAPASNIDGANRSKNDGGGHQKLILFIQEMPCQGLQLLEVLVNLQTR